MKWRFHSNAAAVVRFGCIRAHVINIFLQNVCVQCFLKFHILHTWYNQTEYEYKIKSNKCLSQKKSEMDHVQLLFKMRLKGVIGVQVQITADKLTCYFYVINFSYLMSNSFNLCLTNNQIIIIKCFLNYVSAISLFKIIRFIYNWILWNKIICVTKSHRVT